MFSYDPLLFSFDLNGLKNEAMNTEYGMRESKIVDGASGMTKPIVNVICSTYNHAAYIEQCLDSLLSQKTSFVYQILIHDDASNDGTSEIVERYQHSYPGIIDAVIQPSNIYSRGLSSSGFIEPKLADGYIAICEGDDYWTDENKLQIQYDYMEQHPDTSCFVHSAHLYHDIANRVVGSIGPGNSNHDFGVEDVISGGGGMFATNSIFYRSEDYRLPDAFTKWGIGDWPRMIFLATRGAIHYDARAMSAYRVFVRGSWTARTSSDVRKSVESRKKIVSGLRRADEYTNFIYRESFENAIDEVEMRIEMLEGNWSAAILHDAYKTLSGKRKINGWLESHCPTVGKALRDLYFSVPKMATTQHGKRA